MRAVGVSPFSVRNRVEGNWIDQDFPESGRNGLLHLIGDAIRRDFIADWPSVATEIRRLARASPREYNRSHIESINEAKADAEAFLNEMRWDRAYDFCERVYSHVLQGTEQDGQSFGKAQAQSWFATEVQQLFEEENLAFEFRDGLVQRRGRRHTANQVSKAQGVLGDTRLDAARKHFSKALRYFRDREKADPENAVKEAVCAVEAAAKELFPDSKAATLGDFLKWATGNDVRLLPKTVAQTFTGLYGFRNGGEGVSHGATSGETVTNELAEYVLGAAASQIILLSDLSNNEEEPPF